MPLASTWAPGTIVAGRFEIQELAGRGGTSEVFRARDRESDTQIALKLLSLSGPDKMSLERFLREAQLLAELRHPNVVRYVAHGQPMDGQAFLAMEWLAGEDLGQRLRRGRLGAAESLRLARKVAEVLVMLHGRGILHRDLKPSNLFLRGGHVEQVVLLDFGIARRPPGLGPRTRTGQVVGTLQYLSPEQARSERRLGPATDIYSLGCVLFECLTGEPPFHGDHPGVVLARILCEEAPLLGQLRPGLPAVFESLLVRMLAKRPGDRPAGAQEVLDALAQLERAEALPEETAPARGPALTGGEQRLVSVILAAPPEGDDAEPDPALPED
ncbi:MAG TPA: serine/threonine-protein kinase, partial [Polyangia bacterium]|nr:serine/threonine-protein kinase [Polyangia bacterium]